MNEQLSERWELLTAFKTLLQNPYLQHRLKKLQERRILLLISLGYLVLTATQAALNWPTNSTFESVAASVKLDLLLQRTYLQQQSWLFVLGCLLVPMSIVNGVILEYTKNRMPFVQMTPLSRHQIILGILSRDLVFVLFGTLLHLPITMVCLISKNVELSYILISTWELLVFVLLFAIISFLVGLFCRKNVYLGFLTFLMIFFSCVGSYFQVAYQLGIINRYLDYSLDSDDISILQKAYFRNDPFYLMSQRGHHLKTRTFQEVFLSWNAMMNWLFSQKASPSPNSEEIFVQLKHIDAPYYTPIAPSWKSSTLHQIYSKFGIADSIKSINLSIQQFVNSLETHASFLERKIAQCNEYDSLRSVLKKHNIKFDNKSVDPSFLDELILQRLKDTYESAFRNHLFHNYGAPSIWEYIEIDSSNILYTGRRRRAFFDAETVEGITLNQLSSLTRSYYTLFKDLAYLLAFTETLKAFPQYYLDRTSSYYFDQIYPKVPPNDTLSTFYLFQHFPILLHLGREFFWRPEKITSKLAIELDIIEKKYDILFSKLTSFKLPISIISTNFYSLPIEQELLWHFILIRTFFGNLAKLLIIIMGYYFLYRNIFSPEPIYLTVSFSLLISLILSVVLLQSIFESRAGVFIINVSQAIPIVLLVLYNCLSLGKINSLSFGKKAMVVFNPVLILPILIGLLWYNHNIGFNNRFVSRLAEYVSYKESEVAPPYMLMQLRRLPNKFYLNEGEFFSVVNSYIGSDNFNRYKQEILYWSSKKDYETFCIWLLLNILVSFEIARQWLSLYYSKTNSGSVAFGFTIIFVNMSYLYTGFENYFMISGLLLAHFIGILSFILYLENQKNLRKSE